MATTRFVWLTFGLYVCEGGSCAKMIFAGDQRIAMQQVTTGSISYFHADHLSSTSVVTNGNGLVEEDLVYYPYGETFTNTGTTDVAYKYTGKERDGSTGLYFYEARYYDAALGQFISADTIVPDPNNPQALNRYAYVLNNPMRYTDPSGQTSEGCYYCGGGYDDYSRPDLIEPTFIPNFNYINPSYSANTYNRSSSQDSDLGTRRIFGDNFDGSNLAFVDADADGLYQPSSSTLFSNDDPTNFEISRYDPSAQLPTTFEDGARLPTQVIETLSPYFYGNTLQSMRLFNGLPWFVPDTFKAYTSANTVYFKEGAYNPNTAAGLALIGHEALHVQDFATYGSLRTEYALEYLGNLSRGFGFYDAYRYTSFEDRAFTLERAIRGDFQQRGYPTGLR